MRHYTIATVDDDPEQLSLISDILNDYTVQSFTSATDLFSALKKSPAPDLILCDIHMTNINGYEVCRRARKHTILRKTPIILISGYHGQINFIEAVEAGANEYLEKPFSTLDLKDLVQKQLQLSNTFS